MELNKILQGDCLEVLKTLPENSVDSIVTDPPYELGFMGKSWDSTGIANNKDMWAECLRVLKPGGHLLAFSGTRTYHRMACAIEDAGFEVRDMIEWVYGSGFPKSLSIGKAINKLETNEWSKICKALDNIDQKSIIDMWKTKFNYVKTVEEKLLKDQITVVQDMPYDFFAVFSVEQSLGQKNSSLIVDFAEKNFNEALVKNTKINTVLKNVAIEIRRLQNSVKSAEKSSRNQNHKSWNIFTAECDVKEWLKENIEVNLKVDEALKTLRGNKKYSNEEITNVLCAVLTNALKHTILNQSNTFQNLDTNQKMECASAINVIITEYTAENLISNMVAILKSKAVDKLQGNERIKFIRTDGAGTSISGKRTIYGSGVVKSDNETQEFVDTKGTSEWEGWGTATKPAHEPICMARKPISEKTVAENCLKYGTGGINIDESRVEIPDGDNSGWSGSETWNEDSTFTEKGKCTSRTKPAGRFPANLIHDNSEEVRECFPETNSPKSYTRSTDVMDSPINWNPKKLGTEQIGHGDSGNASRFFKSIVYVPKASKLERNRGCEGLEEQYTTEQNKWTENDYRKGGGEKTVSPTKNNHPTVKPIALMEYLIKMVTPKGGIVLDPFAGSGSTLVAAKQNGYQYIGIEMTEEYIPIIEARLKEVQGSLF